MNSDIIRNFNEKLAEIFSNGKAEVGLEVGSDPGLNFSEYIQIPRSLTKNFVVLINVELWNAIHQNDKVSTSGMKKSPSSGRLDVEFYKHQPGWVVPEKIRIHNGVYECLFKNKHDSHWVEITRFVIDSPTVEDIKKFYAVNQGHVRDIDFDEKELFWIHAIRYWSVVSGLVMSEKSHEFVFVDDPSTYPTNSDNFVEYCMNFMANSFTAVAARATSWRKSNHATGGETLSGFPRRWAQKEGFLKDLRNKAEQKAHERNICSAFYIATHAASVHTVLAMMAPTDETHWSIINPACGMIMNWEVGQSTSVRMAPKTQVSGTAIVIDSMVVLRMMTSEGISPLLQNINQIKALKEAEDLVKKYGVRCAVYSKWFLGGHPQDLTPINFNQRSETFFELASELAIIGTKYYIGSTISESPALHNVVRQCNNEYLKQSWSNVATYRRDVSTDDLIKVIDVIKGNSALPIINKVLNEDFDTKKEGIIEYNSKLKDIAATLGIPVTNEIRVEGGI